MLRAPEPDDLDFLYQLENDAELWAVSDVLPAPVARHTLREYLRHTSANLAEAGQLRLIIEAAGQPVGTLDFYDYSALHQRAGIGVAVLKGARRQGHARRALGQAVHYASHHLLLHQLYCTVAASNEASIKLFTEIGFFQVGIRREWLRAAPAGRWQDAVEMQLLL